MSSLFPAIKPYMTHNIPVSSGHVLYVEECGVPDGIPVLFLHGGPGGGLSPLHRSFYDPNVYRIVLFDQRGSGKSTPHADLTDNTSQNLVADIEVIRQSLGIKSWVVTGGSWGTTLALLYAIEHSERVTGLILRGIFLGRQQDLDWLYGPTTGASQVFPDFYQDFIAKIPDAAASTSAIIDAYYQLLTSPNELRRMQAAKAWATWEGRVSRLRHDPSKDKQYGEPHSATSLARIECHFFQHKCFIEENFILNNIESIANIPGYIIHGRYDMVCKMENALSLKNAWPMAQLQIIQEAGHSAAEVGIAQALCKASQQLPSFL